MAPFRKYRAQQVLVLQIGHGVRFLLILIMMAIKIYLYLPVTCRILMWMKQKLIANCAEHAGLATVLFIMN